MARGSTFDYDGSLGSVESLELRYLINGDRTALSVPAAWEDWDGPRRRWRADGPATDHLRRPLADKDRGTIGIALMHGDHVNVVSARSAESGITPDAAGLPRSITVDGDGHPRARRPRERCRRLACGPGLPRPRPSLIEPARAWFRLPGTTRLGRVFSLVRRDAIPSDPGPVRRPAAATRPRGVRGGGRSRLRGERARAQRRPDRRPGLGTGRPGCTARRPSGCRLHAEAVERLSLRHAWLPARAGLLVGDGPAPDGGPAGCHGRPCR